MARATLSVGRRRSRGSGVRLAPPEAGGKRESAPCAHGSIIIVGAGGHGRVCAEVAAAAGFAVVGFVDAGKAEGERVNGIPVVAATIEALPVSASSAGLFIAVGDNGRRRTLFEAALNRGHRLPALVHPAAVVSPTASIGEGSVVMAGAVVNANTRIGRYCILNTSCSIDHDNLLDDGVQVCPGVRSAGAVRYGAEAFIGTGATVIPGIGIGKGAIVGAGAVVVRDVADHARVAGVPARPIRRR